MDVRNFTVCIQKEGTPFTLDDGTYDLNGALFYCGKCAGICYAQKGLDFCFSEKESKTLDRIQSNFDGEHQSVFEQLNVQLRLINVPKELNMILHNEGQYCALERSLRYTTFKDGDGKLSNREFELYNKWYKIFYDKITELEGNNLSEFKIKNLAKENARSFTSSFVGTESLYNVPLAQLNRICGWMIDFINKEDKNEYEELHAEMYSKFVEEMKRLNLIDERFFSNHKHRSLSMLGKDLNEIPNEFGSYYHVTYDASVASFAQVHRHRTGDYQMENVEGLGYYVPPMIRDDKELTEEFLKDMDSIKDIYPVGRLVRVSEGGSFDDFVMKCMERLCSGAQLEVYEQTVAIRNEYFDSLKEQGHPLVEKIGGLSSPCRCGFDRYTCGKPCGWADGINGNRKV